ncbi:MAG: prolipoprotein diacylglyceryl transferase [Parvularculaceae bacterium]
MALAYPNIDPVAIQLGPVPIRWYSLGYIGGLALGWLYILQILKNQKLWPSAAAVPIKRDLLDDLIFWWVLLGVMVGGRLGYLLFYEPALLVGAWEPLGANMGDGWLKTLVGWLPIPPALMLWRGGMSFHGGFLGVVIAGIWFCRRHRLNALSVGDLFAVAAPIGIFLVRIANFINGELYGRPWNGPWAMVFPSDPDSLARHPSQLYEAALEGLALFVILRVGTHVFHILNKPGAAIGIFLTGYSLSRIVVENFREPDEHLPDFPLGLTMGMMLSAPMLIAGGYFIWRAFRRPAAATAPTA